MQRSVDAPLLLLDACGVLNLAAAFGLDQAERQLGRPLAVVAEAAREVLYLDDVVDGDLVRSRIDASVLEVVEMVPAEVGTFVALTERLDDGEAATLAVASHRGWQALTDDRKAVGVAAGLIPPVRVVSTSDLLRAWSEASGRGTVEVAGVLRAVEARASFIPRRSDPNAAWWRDTLVEGS